MEKENKGFTLLEVIVAAVLLTMGVVGGITGYKISDRQIERANVENELINANGTIQEKVAAMDFNALQSGEKDVALSDIGAEELEKLGISAKYKVTNVPAVADDSANLLYREIEVIVTAKHSGKQLKVASNSIKVNPKALTQTVEAGGGGGGDGNDNNNPPAGGGGGGNNNPPGPGPNPPNPPGPPNSPGPPNPPNPPGPPNSPGPPNPPNPPGPPNPPNPPNPPGPPNPPNPPNNSGNNSGQNQTSTYRRGLDNPYAYSGGSNPVAFDSNGIPYSRYDPDNDPDANGYEQDNSRSCFIAGTKVLTKDGFVPIEEIKENDLVLTKNIESGKNELKKVIIKKFYMRTGMIYIRVEDVDIYCSNNHRFYVVDKGWVEASKLKTGDRLLNYESKELILKDKKLLPKEMEVKVYNLVNIEDNHNFFVTKYGILVHNRKIE